MTLFSCTLRTAKFQCPWSRARRPPLGSALRQYEFEIVENCQRCGPGIGVGGIWLADVAHWRFAGRRIFCVLIQMLLSHLRTGSARIAGKRIWCRDLGELLIAIAWSLRSTLPVFGRPSRADRTLRRILRADCRHDRMWARKWLRLEVSRCESGTPGSRAFVVRIRESAAK